MSLDSSSSSSTGGDFAFNVSSTGGTGTDGVPTSFRPSSLSDLCAYDSELRRLPFAYWGLTFQPYWLVIGMTVFLTLGSYAANALLAETERGRKIVDWWKRTFFPNDPTMGRQQSESSFGTPEERRDATIHLDRLTLPGAVHPRGVPSAADRIILQLSESFLADPVVRWTLMPPSGLLTLQLMLQAAHVIYIGATLRSDQSSWHQYEELYARVLNGGAASFLLPFLLAKLDGEAKRQQRKGWRNNASHYLLNLWSIFLLPALLTHGILVYVFIPLIVAITAVLCLASSTRTMALLLAKCGPTRHGMLLVVMGLNLVVTMLVQMSFNYGVMLYGGENYFRTMYLEYQLHDTRCYTRALAHGVRPMVFSFASLF